MLNNFCAAWNSLFTKHPSEYKTGGVIINEQGIEAKNKRLTVVCSEAVSFPSRQFDCYDMFSALSNRNCDSVLLVKNDEGSFDFVYIEMKSRFSTSEVLGAKKQISETCAKMQSLLRMLKYYSALPIRRVFGVIETKQLDDDQQDYWLKLQQLPDDNLDFGWKLIKYGTVKGETHFNAELDMPAEMTFKLLLSDSDNYTVNYSDLCL